MQLDSSTNASLRSTPFLAGAGACSVSSVGVVAQQQLNSIQQGQVIAVFDRCIYISTTSGLFCVGVAGLGRGPLNALLDSQFNGLPFKIKAYEHIRIFDGQIIFDDSRIIDATNAIAYQDIDSASVWTAPSLQRNREALRTLTGMPNDGFYWLMNSLDYEQIPQSPQSALQLALCKTTSTSVLGLSNWLKLGFDSSSAHKRDRDDQTLK